MIRHSEAYLKSIWNYDFMNEHLPGKCAMSDIDAILERKGNFLVIEIKALNAGIPVGQKRLLEQMVLAGNTTVIYLFGDTDKPEYYRRLSKNGQKVVELGKRVETNSIRFGELISKWFKWADSHPKSSYEKSWRTT